MRLRVLVVGCALALAGCGADVVAADCAPAEPQQRQEGSHLLGDQTPPVPYLSVPPTSGWHSSGQPPAPGVYGEPVPEPEQVSVLETGGVVVAYDPGLPEDVVAELQEVPAEVDGVVVTPYDTEMPRPIALTAWGVLQRCDAVTAEGVAAFRDEHATTPGH